MPPRRARSARPDRRPSLARPPRLAPLQRWFFDQLQPGARRDRGAVRSTPDLGAQARLQIYADMYLARLLEALRLEFPRLHQQLGDRRFVRLARGYLTRHPSRHPTIQDIGDRFARHLEGELVAGRLRGFPHAADLARLERATSQVFFAADSGELLTVEALRAVPAGAWPELRLRPVPSLRLLRLRFSFFGAGAPLARPIAGPAWVRLWRRGFEVFQAPMDRRETAALRAVLRGDPFTQVAYAAGDAQRAATFLATWVAEDLLIA